MNDRIREPYYSIMYKASEGWNDHLFQVPSELMEKFAELIVKECLNICQECIDDGCVEAEEPMWKIEQHFGVEE
jgi:hypothetical protein